MSLFGGLKTAIITNLVRLKIAQIMKSPLTYTLLREIIETG